MRFAITYTFDTELMKRRLKRLRCLWRHDWHYHQGLFRAEDDGPTAVIAWKVCHRCGKSKLIHILT